MLMAFAFSYAGRFSTFSVTRRADIHQRITDLGFGMLATLLLYFIVLEFAQNGLNAFTKGDFFAFSRL